MTITYDKVRSLPYENQKTLKPDDSNFDKAVPHDKEDSNNFLQ